MTSDALREMRDAVRVRCRQAEARLLALADGYTGDERTRLEGKAEGVILALSYIDEEIKTTLAALDDLPTTPAPADTAHRDTLRRVVRDISRPLIDLETLSDRLRADGQESLAEELWHIEVAVRAAFSGVYMPDDEVVQAAREDALAAEPTPGGTP